MTDPAQRRTHDTTRTAYTSPAGGSLPLLLCAPSRSRPAAAVLLFHGGGWQTGSAEQFAPQCQALASQGILAAGAGYRLVGQGAATLCDCLDDARAAIEHVRGLAPGVPLFVGGGSAGGQLALAAVLTPPTADERPYAGLLLFNPVVDLCEPTGTWQTFREILGLDAQTAAALSPLHLVRPGAPPAIVFHGTADALVPIHSVRHFRDAMRAAGNACRLVEYEGAPHGFFNPGAGEARWHEETTALAAAFVLEPSTR